MCIMQRPAVKKEARKDIERMPDETTDEFREHHEEQQMKDKQSHSCCGPAKHTLPPMKTGRKNQNR